MKKTVLMLSLAAAFAAGSFTWSMRGDAAAPKVRAYFAVLTPGQEPENPTSDGSGVAFITLDEKTLEIRVSHSVTTTGTVVAAHVHGPAQPGVSTGIVGPLGTTKTAVSTITLTKTQVRDLKKGLLYLNFHTDTAPLGEIRGQIMPTAPVYPRLAN